MALLTPPISGGFEVELSIKLRIAVSYLFIRLLILVFGSNKVLARKSLFGLALFVVFVAPRGHAAQDGDEISAFIS